MKQRSLWIVVWCALVELSGCGRSSGRAEPSDAAPQRTTPDVEASPATPASRDRDAAARMAGRPATEQTAARASGTNVSAGPESAATSQAGSSGLVTSQTDDDAGLVLDAGSPREPAPQTSAESGRAPVGTTRIEINARRMRRLPVQLWYPTTEALRAQAAAGRAMSELEPPGPQRDLLEKLLASAPAACTNRTMHAALDAPVASAPGPYPLLVYSHHLEGMRTALFSLAEALAGRGFVVAAPDHVGRTLFDRDDDLQTADPVASVLRSGLDDAAVRADDIESVLDVLLDPQADAVPDALRGQLDAQRVGMFGHSMGSMTSGIVTARESRVRAAAFLSYPPARTAISLGQPTIGELQVPALFMLNREDAPLSAVSALDSIREQFESYSAQAYLVEVNDTGHWSFADDCGLIADFMDGCGMGTRQAEPHEAFAFLAPSEARRIAAHYVGAFFSEQFLAADSEALLGPPLSSAATLKVHDAP